MLNCVWTCPSQSCCTTSRSRKWVKVMVPLPWQLTSFYNAGCRVKKQRGCVVCCLFKYLIIFFSAVNANLLQTCLELISALPASSASVKDSGWNLCLTVTKVVLIKSCCVVRPALEVAPKGHFSDRWRPASAELCSGALIGPVWSRYFY